MTTFPRPWHPVVEVTILGRHGIEGRETRKLVLGTHVGTHCDAPLHFIPTGGTVDQIPLETLMGPATVLDFSGCAQNQELTVTDFEERLADRRPERLILRFDWCKHFSQMSFYTDHAYLSHEAAHWLVDRGVRLLGMDTPQPDNPRSDPKATVDSPIHKILLGNGVILVEYLCNLSLLHSSEIEFIALPLKILGADGSPVRAIAIER
jgi:kynurenine formamidase